MKGKWSCVPGRTLPRGAGRLQATATLNGVSAMSEQIHIMVAGSAEVPPDTVSDGEGRRLQDLSAGSPSARVPPYEGVFS